MTKRDAEHFLELTSVYDLNALRQIAEGMALHSRFVDDSDAFTVMNNVTQALKEFIAYRSRAVGAARREK